MDTAISIKTSLTNSPDEIPITGTSSVRGILKKPSFKAKKIQSKRSLTTYVKSTTKVTFSDKVKDIPICTVIEVEPLNYDIQDSPKGKYCACLIF